MTHKPNASSYSTDPDHPLYDPTMDPTHPFYERDRAQSDATSFDRHAYKVGPGFPPNEHKWKKGGRSPNPKGRPKKVPSMKPDLKKALESALNEKIVVTSKDKKEVVLTKASLGIQQLVNQFAKGDRHARRDLFQYAAQLGVDLHAKDIITEALGINEAAIVESYVQRRLQQSPEASPEDRVKAPPDLLDDDVTESQPNENPVNSSQPDTRKKTPEPVLDESGKPKPTANVSDIEYILAARKRYLAQQKKNQEES
jgi:hypothetical protein